MRLSRSSPGSDAVGVPEGELVRAPTATHGRQSMGAARAVVAVTITRPQCGSELLSCPDDRIAALIDT
jgi:hypothetical protein